MSRRIAARIATPVAALSQLAPGRGRPDHPEHSDRRRRWQHSVWHRQPTCTVVRVTKSGAPRLTCSGVYELNDGDIVVAGRLSGGNTDRLAVIGGTGAYAGARGTLSSVNGATRTVDTIDLLP
jgi:hypothetical protein